MSAPIIDQALEIIEKTNDGNDLSPAHLYLVQTAVNGWLSEAGEVAFAELYANVQRGYVKPWFCGIEHLTIDHEGYVYWKGVQVEHYTTRWMTKESMHESAADLADRCRQLEAAGVKVSVTTAIWRWPDSLKGQVAA